MRKATPAVVIIVAASALGLTPLETASRDVRPAVGFTRGEGKLEITIGERPFATYVYEDARIPRPYFAHVQSPAGVQVTRSHPPVPGKDPTDHDTFHPGIWLAFGDLSGADFWRNKARVRHEGFASEPQVTVDKGSFAVRNCYEAPDGALLCRETVRYAIYVRPFGYLLAWDSEFSPNDEIVFGDQEEMGLGVRMATPLSVQKGGRIINSAGQINEKEVWGKPADWCDYRGVVDRTEVGITLMPHPGNFRRSWFHARDYGLLVANPFGREAFTKGEKSRVSVPAGQRFRLRFGILIHSGSAELKRDFAAAYRDYVSLGS
jgi:hypothetical protein